MSEKNTLKIIDGTLKSVEDNFKQFIDVLETAKNELINFERATKMLETEKVALEREKTELELEKQKLEAEKAEKEQKIGELTSEQLRLLDEYKNLKIELKKFMKIAQDQEESEYNFERIKALLSITMLLIREIWQGQPHYRILLTLHGDKEEMTREEIKNTTGISGAMVLRAVHELANIDVLQYDEEKSLVKLKRRLFAKKALEKKPEE
ncbi:MAG: coiled-coil domain-containing protein [Candidatus Hermodarchaeota archaeon]